MQRPTILASTRAKRDEINPINSLLAIAVKQALQDVRIVNSLSRSLERSVDILEVVAYPHTC